MKEHELKVKHKGSGVEYIVSKSHYLENVDKYEIVEGEAPEKAESDSWEPPKAPPAPKLADPSEENKMDGGADEDKAEAKAKAPAKPKTAPAPKK